MINKEKNKELNALINLLDDPDFEVYLQIKDKLISIGFDAIPFLETAWENAFDPIRQKRIEDIVHQLQLNDLFAELHSWAHFNYNDLLKGMMLLSKFQYPDQDDEKIIKTIGRITQDVWLELNQNLTALEKIKVINHILYDHNKFKGNASNINAPENYYINNILQTKKGTPVSLGALFIVIAQGLKLPVHGVDLPRHFILAYLDEIIEIGKIVSDDNNVLFYINPFNKGALFTRNEIELYLKQLALENDDNYYLPCANITIVKRMINELIGVYKDAGNDAKMEELNVLLKALD
ncbi:transglutaminase-like domain-containing protein [Bacteroidota bacterium]